MSLLSQVIAQGTSAPPNNQGAIGQGVIYAAIMVCVVLLVTIALVKYRKVLFGDDSGSGPSDIPISLEVLRKMRSEGNLSDEEFEKAAGLIKKMAPGSNPLRDEIQRRARERDQEGGSQGS